MGGLPYPLQIFFLIGNCTSMIFEIYINFIKMNGNCLQKNFNSFCLDDNVRCFYFRTFLKKLKEE